MFVCTTNCVLEMVQSLYNHMMHIDLMIRIVFDRSQRSFRVTRGLMVKRCKTRFLRKSNLDAVQTSYVIITYYFPIVFEDVNVILESRDVREVKP